MKREKSEMKKEEEEEEEEGGEGGEEEGKEKKPNFITRSNIPNSKTQIFIFNSFDIEPFGREGKK